MLIAGYGYIVLFVLLVFSKILLPQESSGWSNPPIYDYIILFGFGVCISVLGVVYSYFAWTRNAREYVRWFLDQAGSRIKWQVELISSQPDFALWLARLIAPLIAVFGITLIGYILYSISVFLLGQ
jgi:multisubunit Na+/H+ antiporter MnhB subunit